MAGPTCTVVLVLVLGLFSAWQGEVSGQIHHHDDNSSSLKYGANVRSCTYMSPPIPLGPGEVSNKNYKIEFPSGHIAVKGFEAELVDEEGKSVPLNEVYLHHWIAQRFFVDNVPSPGKDFYQVFNSTAVFGGNAGLCDGRLTQFFGLGSETRHTNYAIPDPYAIVFGDPAVIPKGSKEAWLLNVHAINTIKTVDPHGCAECRCDLYDVDVSSLKYAPANYIGGLFCCDDGTTCALTSDLPPVNKTYFLKYSVYWRELDASVVPVKVYILDVTDTSQQKDSQISDQGCRVEYDVAACDDNLPAEPCVDTAEAVVPPLPKGGHIVYAVAHQHAGGIGCTMYGEDDRELCTSEPFYGSGNEAGDEAGYIVGMGVCYPKQGTGIVRTGEKLKLRSRYNSQKLHTGVMGLFYVLVAEDPEPVV